MNSTYFEGTSGQTWGKQMMWVEAASAFDGQRINMGRASTRNFLRIIDWLPFIYILGLILISATEKKQRLVDFAANAVVVRV